MFPMEQKSSIFRGGSTEDLIVPEEYSQFMDRYPAGTLLISFGTTFMPTESMVNVLLAGLKELPDTGFIISIKESTYGHQTFKKANLPNVFLKTFVPQKALLNDPRILALMSHGGANSVLESVYYGKVLVCFPVAMDQPSSCYRVERLGIGKSLMMNPSKELVVSLIKQSTAREGIQFQKSLD
jgi:UDP:flavonoid glycosyltransferase YjiC (YdhE family)